MKDKNIIISSILLLTIVISLISTCIYKNKEPVVTNKLEGVVLCSTDNTVTVQDKNNGIYTFKIDDLNIDSGSKIVIEYTGLLNKDNEMQDVSVINYNIATVSDPDTVVADMLEENGIFSKYYKLAENKLKELTLDEKIGQIFLVRYPDNALEELKKYHFSGFVFYTKDFQGKTKTEVQNMINELQQNSKIPLLTAVDEEGGVIVRISSNTNLAPERFKSPQNLYAAGGFDTIKEDTINKSKLLKDLGLNVNLAPVVDVSTDPSDYMYNRTLGENTAKTSEYAETVINASKGTGVSYTLKHFPGYGNNSDTHLGVVTDNRDRDDITANDLPPFKAGIDAGAEAVLVSHNIVANIDSNNPASLSPAVHNILRNDLGFTGIIMTDDLDMSALTPIGQAAVEAILAGNDLIITTNYDKDFTDVKNALDDGTISEELIDKLALRVLAWKYYKGLMNEDFK